MVYVGVLPIWIFAIIYGHFVYVVVIWYISPILVYCTKKNLATVVASSEVSTNPVWQAHAWDLCLP
jgi:hypothetical protein